MRAYDIVSRRMVGRFWSASSTGCPTPNGASGYKSKVSIECGDRKRVEGIEASHSPCIASMVMPRGMASRMR